MTPFTALTIRDLRPATQFGPVPELRWLPIARLCVDGTYQRAVSSRGLANIATIAETFDWRKFSPAVCAPVAGGFYAVIDGQHRIHAALLCGLNEVPCLIIQADGALQAKAFAAINAGVTKLQPQQILKARKAAGDPEMAAIDRVTQACGVNIVWINVSLANMGRVACCATPTLQALFRAGGEAYLAAVLHAIGACKAGAQTPYTAFWLKTFGDALHVRKDWWAPAVLQSALAEFSLANCEAKARAQWSADRSVPLSVYAASFITKRLAKATETVMAVPA